MYGGLIMESGTTNEIRFDNRMKNFMGQAGGGGQYSSSSSSSCSSSPTAHHHRHHHPHPHHHEQQQQQQSGSSSFPLPYYPSPPSSSGYNAYGRGVGPRDMEMVRRAELQDEEGMTTMGMGMGIEKEHMFDKVVTPSDVGKLNRLVIPKQHAEKYFPLDSSTNEKGLLLNFEDRSGKPWRFRYSYWNSSQSYVMTKGWSRFVKEKKLDAGDVVSFHRGMGDSAKDRLFIDWRRRPEAPSPLPPHHFAHYHPSAAAAWAQYPPPPYYLQAAPPPPPPHLIHMSSRLGNPRPPNSLVYGHHHHLHRSGRPGGMGMVFESVPVVQGKAAAKRMRLFGVNISTDTPAEALPTTAAAATDQHLGLFLSNPNRPAASNSMSLDFDI